MSLLELYCHIDDFWQEFEPKWQETVLTNGSQRRRQGVMSMSELMTIVVHFHQQRYRDFKTYYIQYVGRHLSREFPKQISYNRFIQLMPRILIGLCEYLRHCYGQCRGIGFIDSTALAVCHNRRIKQHRVFEEVAQRGRTSVDWFYGFKLHLVVNDCGELLSCCVTAGTVDDRQPVPKLVQHLWGKLFGDKGYLSQPLADQLMEDHALELITKVRSNMKQRVVAAFDQVLLRKRAIIESIYDQLKNISQIEHTRHRSLVGFMNNVLGGLIAYCHQPKKPTLNLEFLHAIIPA